MLNKLGYRMSADIFRSIREEIRKNISTKDRWESNDYGLITCWEVGREKRRANDEVVAKAEIGELPVLGWKGGIAESTKLKKKYGSLKYLAQWQGLRGEDLKINTSLETIVVCKKTGITVIFTSDTSKF